MEPPAHRQRQAVSIVIEDDEKAKGGAGIDMKQAILSIAGDLQLSRTLALYRYPVHPSHNALVNRVDRQTLLKNQLHRTRLKSSCFIFVATVS